MTWQGTLWFGVLSGFIATAVYAFGAWIGIVLIRYHAAKRFTGTWQAMVIVERELVPMNGAGETVIKIRCWREPLYLVAEALDTTAKGQRPHTSTIRIDSADMRRAVRILDYADGQFETDAQELILLESGRIHVRSFVRTDVNVHVLEKIN